MKKVEIEIIMIYIIMLKNKWKTDNRLIIFLRLLYEASVENILLKDRDLHYILNDIISRFEITYTFRNALNVIYYLMTICLWQRIMKKYIKRRNLGSTTFNVTIVINGLWTTKLCYNTPEIFIILTSNNAKSEITSFYNEEVQICILWDNIMTFM